MSPPTGRYGGLSTGSVNAEPVCRLCQLIINEINSRVRPGGPKKFLKQGPTGKSPGFPVGQSATAKTPSEARRREAPERRGGWGLGRGAVT